MFAIGMHHAFAISRHFRRRRRCHVRRPKRVGGLRRDRPIGTDRRRQGHRQADRLPHAPCWARRRSPFKPDKVPFWHDHFVVPGKILLKLPLGNYTFVIERGLEYLDPRRPLHDRPLRRRLEAGRTAAVHRHGGRRLVVGRPGRPPPGARHRTADGGRRPARGRSRSPGGTTRTHWGGQRCRKQPLVRFDGNRYYHLLARRRRPGRARSCCCSICRRR